MSKSGQPKIWHISALPGSPFKRARLLHPRASGRSAVAALQKQRNVTAVTLHCAFLPSCALSSPFHLPNGKVQTFIMTCGSKILRALAKGCPKVTSFDVRLCLGWEALLDLQHFLSHATSVQELSLSFVTHNPGEGIESSRYSPWLRAALCVRWCDSHRAMLARLNFAALTKLRTLKLDSSEVLCHTREGRSRHAPTPALRLPVSKTLTHLPGLTALHVTVSHAAQLSQLPPWLGQLDAVARLSVTCGDEAYICQVVESPAATNPSQWLQVHIKSPAKVADTHEVTAVGNMQGLAALAATHWRLTESESAEEILGRVIFHPSVQTLRLSCNALPPLRAPLPLLEDLSLFAIAPQQRIQRNLFEFMPAVRSLDLGLWEEPDGLRLKLSMHLAGLRTLRVEKGPTGGSRCVCDVRGLGALVELEIDDCGALECLRGTFDLGPATAVTLMCWCWVDLAPTAAAAAGPARFGSYKEYALARRPCANMPRCSLARTRDAMARKLFHDSRRVTAGIDAQKAGGGLLNPES